MMLHKEEYICFFSGLYEKIVMKTSWLFSNPIGYNDSSEAVTHAFFLMLWTSLPSLITIPLDKFQELLVENTLQLGFGRALWQLYQVTNQTAVVAKVIKQTIRPSRFMSILIYLERIHVSISKLETSLSSKFKKLILMLIS